MSGHEQNFKSREYLKLKNRYILVTRVFPDMPISTVISIAICYCFISVENPKNKIIINNVFHGIIRIMERNQMFQVAWAIPVKNKKQKNKKDLKRKYSKV